jgi:tetratricopeptide (TPR) repeat protein
LWQIFLVRIIFLLNQVCCCVMTSHSDVLLLLQRRIMSLAVRRSGLAFCLFGEAGIGKSHAIAELLKNTPFQSVMARAVTPIAQVMSSLPHPKRLPTWLERQVQLGASLETFLAWLEALAPFVLHVEDWHEASAEAQDFWVRLAVAAQQKKGVGVVLTSRIVVPSSLESLRLLPLDFAGSAALLQSEVGAELPLQAMTWIFSKSAGNPLFTVEFLKHLARLGLLWNDTKRWHWREPPEDAMPITVEALIEQLLFESSNTAEYQVVLQAQAFLESRVPQLILESAFLASVADVELSQLEAAQAHWVRRGILTPTGFAHPLFREVTFRQLLPNARKVFATRALSALQISQPELAAEFLTESQLPPESAFATLMACATALENQPSRAAQLKARAAQFLHGEEKAILLLEALKVLVHSEPKEVLVYAESILELPDLPQDLRTDAIYYATSAIVTTTRNIVAAEESLARLPPHQLGDARYVSSVIGFLMMCGQPARALETWQAHPELHGSVETPVLIHVLSALMLTGQMQAAEPLTLKILAHPNLLPREKMSVLNIRAISLAQLGHFELSETVALEAIDLAEQLEQHNAVGAMLFNRAMTLERSGQRAAMRDHALRALVALEKAGNTGLAVQAGLLLSNDDFEAGREEQAEESLNAAYATLKQAAISPFLVTVELTLTRFHLQRPSQYSQTLSLKYARDALRHAERLGQAKLLASSQTHLCLALLQTGQVLEAQALLEMAFPVLQEVPDANSCYVLSAQAKVLEARGEAANVTWQAAIDRAEQLGFLFDAHSFRLELARVENNLELAKTSQIWFEEQGLLHGVKIARRYFPETQTHLPLELPTMQLQVLGSMQIVSAGVVSAVKGQKRKELLALLLEARISGRSEVKTLDLLDVLYPNSFEEEAQVSLRQTVFKARAAHGTSLIITSANGYALGSISSDAEEFLMTKNMQLWRGTYLDGLGASAEIREMLIGVCQNQSQQFLETNPKEVVRVMRILLETDPYDLVTLKLACAALRLDNNHRTLQRLYAEARAKLLEVDEVLPERWQEFLQ